MGPAGKRDSSRLLGKAGLEKFWLQGSTTWSYYET